MAKIEEGAGETEIERKSKRWPKHDWSLKKSGPLYLSFSVGFQKKKKKVISGIKGVRAREHPN